MSPSAFLLLCLKLLALHHALAEVKVVEQPKNASLYEGQKHTLNCKFNELVNCTWTKGEIPILIYDRYRYLTNSGIYTDQCSIEISIAKIDASNWQCSGKGSDESKNVVRSDFAFLTVNVADPVLSPQKVAILLNNEPITDQFEFTEANEANLVCVAKTIGRPINFRWEVDGNVIPGENVSTNCDNQLCGSTLQWNGGWKSLSNSTTLSCLVEGNNRNISSSVTLHSSSSNTTTIVFFPLLAAASVVLLIVLVASAVACFKCKRKRPDPATGLYPSSDELFQRCDSVQRVPPERISPNFQSVHNSVYKGGSYPIGHKVPRRGKPFLPPQQCELCGDQDAPSNNPSYLELSARYVCNCPCHLDVLNGEYCQGNCTSHCPHLPNPNQGGCSEIQNTGNALYCDGQSMEDVNARESKRQHAHHAPSCPDCSNSNQRSSDESLYNDCYPIDPNQNQARNS